MRHQPALKFLNTPFILNTAVFDQHGNPLPNAWCGVALYQHEGRSTYFYIGREGSERTWNGLQAQQYDKAIIEAESNFGPIRNAA